MRKSIIIAMTALTLASSASMAQKREGLAMTPPMGWSSWNKFNVDIDEEKIRGIADALVETGLRDCGYVYVNIDDAWHGERDSLGFIQCDPVKFPSGMKALSDYIHSKGLKFGIYSDAGYQTCAMYPGSRGHEFQDAMQYANWGVDYLKFDWFRQNIVLAEGAYELMRDALYATGRPIVFSICEWGENHSKNWAPRIGHLWRTGGDIGAYWDVSPCHEKPILDVIEHNMKYRDYAGPDHWADPDMLEVGNRDLTEGQNRAHFSMWCIMASPLILGNDLREVDDKTLAILKNREAIAIDQDSLGIMGKRVKYDKGIQYWFKPLMNGDWAVVVLNVNKVPAEVTLDWNEFDFYDELSKRATSFKDATYTIRNIWTAKNEGKTDKPRTITIPGEDCVMYRLIR